MPNGNILQELISQGKTVNKEQPQSFDQLSLLQEAVQKELLKIKTEETRNLANQGYKAEQIAQANNFSLDPNTQGKNVLQKLMSSLPAIAEVLSEGQYSQSKLREAQIQGQQTEAQLGQQELRGEKPLQKGEREKLGIETSLELQKELIKQAQEGLLKPNELFVKFEAASQPYITVRDAYSRMQSLVGEASPAGDLGYIFSYMKLLDPPSTIREGEQATAQNASAIPDRIRNLYNKVVRGQKLTPEQRKDFENRATQFYKSMESQQKKTTEEFSKLATRSNIDPRVLIRDTGLQSFIPDNTTNRQDDGKQLTTKSGNKYRRVQ